MRISVLLQSVRARLRPITLDDVPGLPLENLLYVPLPPRGGISDLDHLLHRLPSSTRRAADLIVLRAHSTEAQELLTNTDVQERISHRVEGKPVWLLTQHDRDGRFTALGSSRLGPPDSTNTISSLLSDRLRHADLEALCRQPGVLLPDAPNFHYEGPNRSHYSAFLRVGTALQSVDALESASFWLAPFVTADTVVVVDTSSILALALNLSRYVTENALPGRRHVRLVESLRSYDESPEALLQRLARAGDRLGHVLLVISVSSTGRLRQRMAEAIAPVATSGFDVVCLFGTSPDPQDDDTATTDRPFCLLDRRFMRHSAEMCPLCAARSAVVRIDPNTYHLEVAAATTQTRIRISDAARARDFLSLYRGLGSLAVHRDQHDGQRHHMIHIDVTPLLSNHAFLGRLHDILERFRNDLDVLLAPSHPAATGLAAVVGAHLGVPPIYCDEHRLGELKMAHIRALKRARRILIVDDVVITGDRLRQYKHFLREGGFLTQDPDLRWLVAVARPTSKENLQAITDMTGPSFFHAVETLFIPNWGRDECPWCWEFSRLRSLGNRAAVTPPMRRRYRALENTRTGLERALFLHWSSTGALSTALKLGPRAIFGANLSDVELFTSVASAIQTLRSGDKLDEYYVAPYAKVLSPTFYLRGRYYDAIIAAAIIRASTRNDLRSTVTDPRLLTGLTQRLKEAASIELRAELLLAVAQEKLPRIPAITDAAALWTGERGVCAFLRGILVPS